MENALKCKFCGTHNVETSLNCSSCGAPLPRRSNLSDKDVQNLSNYIISIDNALKKAKEAGGKSIAIAFVLLAVVALVSIVGFYFLFYSKTKLLFYSLSVLWAFILFILFGFTIQIFEGRAIKKEFDYRIKYEIKEYLQQMNYTEADFKVVASKTLKEDSMLIKFIADF